MAVALIDNFLELQWLPLARLQLLGITALLVASKFEERFAPHVSFRQIDGAVGQRTTKPL